jgi:hypothetical protein
MFSIKKCAFAFTGIIGLLALTACMPPGNETANVASATQPPIAPTTSTISAHPSIGDVVGVVGTGNEAACDSSLKTVRFDYAGVFDYNGTSITYSITSDQTSKSATSEQVPNTIYTLSFTNGSQPKIVAAIVRATDSYNLTRQDGSTLSGDDPRPDSTISWVGDLQEASTVWFYQKDFNAINGIDGIELCIDPTQTAETPTPTPTN